MIHCRVSSTGVDPQDLEQILMNMNELLISTSLPVFIIDGLCGAVGTM